MARPAGFEPTTPWFVAKYSNPTELRARICSETLQVQQLMMARPAGFEPTTPWFVAKYSNPTELRAR